LIPGDRILLDDGAFELRVVNLLGLDVDTEVIVGGNLKSNKGVNLPGSKLDISVLTEKDVTDLAFGLKHGVDVVAISFVTSISDIGIVREKIEKLAPDRRDTPVIAKLERREAVDNLGYRRCGGWRNGRPW
jgi:pyruvate kinase